VPVDDVMPRPSAREDIRAARGPSITPPADQGQAGVTAQPLSSTIVPAKHRPQLHRPAMYLYDSLDHDAVRIRAAQFRDQVERRLRGDLTEEEFKPLRLQNGLYLQLHAYMLRVAIPYGTLSSTQMRGLAGIARDFDRGFGHFTTRQNIQFNWIRLVETPDILDRLAGLEMHAIQTSGNCIRNVTADPLAGAAPDEIEDARVWAEIIRQWSTFHPEFAFLPRKFKIAVSAAAEDRAATAFHDIGLRLARNRGGETGFRVVVGGGQGRTPRVARKLAHFVPVRQLLSYLEAIMRVYNAAGRRDNIYKARIKILVDDLGIESFAEAVNREWLLIKDSATELPREEYRRIAAHFAPPTLPSAPASPPELAQARQSDINADGGFDRWLRSNVMAHHTPGYANVSLSLKSADRPPGDASASEMEVMADLADRFGRSELRVTYTQNIIVPHVRRDCLAGFYRAAHEAGLHGAEEGLISDMIACPGLDYCNLANARSLPLAEKIFRQFPDPARRAEIGRLRLNISGCINACGHHHAADIGVLGVNKKGVEHYQITLGGRADEAAAIGRIIGPSFAEDEVPRVIETIVDRYLATRRKTESFADNLLRLGLEPYKQAVYADPVEKT
jgi:sulfite reductase (NADPH) hemoprotein beta-component